jgi:gas vesicle protein
VAGNNWVSKAGFFVAGVGLGAVVALLLAPKAGKETRRLIVRTAEGGRDYVAEQGRDLRRQAEDVLEKSREFVAKQKDRLADAFKAS